MTNNKPNRSDLLKKLFSEISFEVTQTIEIIRNEGDNEYIAPLTQLFLQSKDNEVKKEIEKLFAELKEQSSVDFLIMEITKPQNKNALKFLVASCWLNGLNFSGNFATFVQIMANEPFEIAFEAYTLIDNSFDNISSMEARQLVDLLDNITIKDKNIALLTENLIAQLRNVE